MCRLPGPPDFDRREAVSYPVSDGAYTMDYATGAPVLTFRPKG